MAFRDAVYYVASEDLFSNGFTSKLIKFLVAPIPIKKQTTDMRAILNCIKVAREGGTIAMAPEGNRTYSGKTEYMNPAIVKMAKKFKLPIALLRIEDGYGIHPRWSDVLRKGSMHASVTRVIEPEEYANLKPAELFQLIEEGLYVDEAVADGTFRHPKRAEYLERAIYVCPFCGLAEFESKGHLVTCKKCGRTVEYGEDKRLTGQGFDFPFQFVGPWYDYQKQYVNSLDTTKFTEEPLYRDTASFSEVIVYQKKVPLRKDCAVSLYGDRIVLDEGSGNDMVLPFEEITAAACLGRNKLNIYHGKQVYQFKGGKRFNALKYVHIYNRYKNIARGDENGKFLGL